MPDNEKNYTNADSFLNPSRYSKRVRRLKFINNFLHYSKYCVGVFITIFLFWFFVATMFSF